MEIFGAISDSFTLSIGGKKKEINISGNQIEAICVADSLLYIVTFYFPDSCQQFGRE